MKNPLLKTTVALAAFSFCTVSFVSAGDDNKPPRPSKEEMLQKFDANGDGKLDKTEREAVREHMQSMRGEGGRGPGGGADRMAEFDANGDGKLDKTERAAAASAMRERMQGNERAMKRFDTDGDGQLSDAEWQKASKAMRDRMGEGRRKRGE